MLQTLVLAEVVKLKVKCQSLEAKSNCSSPSGGNRLAINMSTRYL